jgi:hypothetical protein
MLIFFPSFISKNSRISSVLLGLVVMEMLVCMVCVEEKKPSQQAHHDSHFYRGAGDV